MKRPSRIIASAALSLLVVGCAELAPSLQATPPANFIQTLDGSGQTFATMFAPPNVVAPDVVLQRLEADGFPPFAQPEARAAPPIYGVLTCRVAAECPEGPGFAEPGHPVAIWLVVWLDVSGANGGLAYAAVDAATGQFIFGDGPPGP